MPHVYSANGTLQHQTLAAAIGSSTRRSGGAVGFDVGDSSPDADAGPLDNIGAVMVGDSEGVDGREVKGDTLVALITGIPNGVLSSYNSLGTMVGLMVAARMSVTLNASVNVLLLLKVAAAASLQLPVAVACSGHGTRTTARRYCVPVR